MIIFIVVLFGGGVWNQMEVDDVNTFSCGVIKFIANRDLPIRMMRAEPSWSLSTTSPGHSKPIS
jgi:hypothetical protein